MTDHLVPLHLARVRRAGLGAAVLHFAPKCLRRRRDMAHLADLPDYLLEDVGLSRAVARKIAWRNAQHHMAPRLPAERTPAEARAPKRNLLPFGTSHPSHSDAR